MGQKVNPVGLRIGISRDWNSRWYANNKDFATFLHEDVEIRRFLTKTLKENAVSHIEIERIKNMVKQILLGTSQLVKFMEVLVALLQTYMSQMSLLISMFFLKIMKQMEKKTHQWGVPLHGDIMGTQQL